MKWLPIITKRTNKMTNFAYVVVDENVLGYIKPGMIGVGILAASILRGATCDPLGGSINMPRDMSRIRLAKLDDFDSFRICMTGSFGREVRSWLGIK